MSARGQLQSKLRSGPTDRLAPALLGVGVGEPGNGAVVVGQSFEHM